MFRLIKWYLDLVTDEGAAVILYAASLEWARLQRRYASVFLSRPDPAAPPREAATWSDVVLPEEQGNILRFRHSVLGVKGEWHREAAPIEERLLHDDTGSLHWSCRQPNASVHLDLGGEALSGRGYVECLEMTYPPWALPFRSLRWGRFTSPAESIVWIHWSGGSPRQWVRRNGVAEPGAVVEDSGVTCLSGGRRLTLLPGRALCDRRALQVVSRGLPAMDWLLVGPIRHLREIKRLDRAVLCHGELPVSRGWVIHEVVTW